MLSQYQNCASSNTIQCAVAFNSPSTGFDQLNITITEGLAAASRFLLTIQTVRNLPSLQPVSSFTIQTSDAQGNLIEVCQGLALNLVNPGSLTPQSFVRIQQNTTINQVTTVQFYLNLANPLPVGSQVRVLFPQEVQVSNAFTFTSYSGLDDASTVALSTRLNASGVNKQSIDLSNGIKTYVQERDGVLFEIGGITNPNSTAPTGSFELFTFDGGMNSIDQLTTGLTLQATQGKLTAVKVTPVDQFGVLQYATQYSLLFTLSNPVSSQCKIVVTFPTSSFTVNSRTCSVKGTINGLVVSSSAQCISTSPSIIISNIFPAQASSKLALTISGLSIRNPVSQSEAIIVSTQTSNGYTVDHDQTQTVKPTSFNISQASLTSSSYQTNNPDAVYTFTVVPPGYLLPQTTIVISLPASVLVANSQLLSRKCSPLSGFTSSSITCSYSTSSNSVTIVGGFAGGQSSDPPTLVFSIPGLRNPRSLTQTSSFGIKILYGNPQSLLFSIQQGVFLQMTSVSKMQSVSILRTSTVNGQIANYTFTLALSNSVQNFDSITIASPTVNPISFSTNTTKCIGLSTNLFSNLSCSVINGGTTLNVTLKTRLLRQLQVASSSLTFLITRVTNPVSMKPTSSFIITQADSTGALVEQTSSNVTLKNTQAGSLSFSQIKITPVTYQTGAVTPYGLTFSPLNYQQGMYLILILPAEIQLNSTRISCASLSGISTGLSCSYNSTTKTINVTNGFQSPYLPAAIEFIIGNFSNPGKELETASFKFYSYTSDGYLLDSRETGLQLNFKCSLPCKTCIPSNNTGCSSCFVGQQDFPQHLQSQQCYDECPLQTYSKSDSLECDNCYASECLECSGPDRGQCLTCDQDYALFEGSCVRLTQQTYFFPILILSVIWLLLSLFATYHWVQTWFLTMAIIGISLLEKALILIEAAAFAYYEFIDNLNLALAGGLLTSLFASICLLVIYALFFKKNEAVAINSKKEPKVYTVVLILSFILDNRLFKLLYSHIGNRAYLNLNKLFEERLSLICFYIYQAFSMLSSAVLIFNAIDNLRSISIPLSIKLTTSVDAERVLVSGTNLILMGLELIYLKRQKPQWLQKGIESKIGSEEIEQLAQQKKPLYHEIPNQSFATHPDGPLNNTKEDLRSETVLQMMDNIKSLRPEEMMGKLKELLNGSGKEQSPSKSHKGNQINNKDESDMPAEWEILKREKEQLSRLRDELEKERLEFEKIKAQESRKGYHSERGSESSLRNEKIFEEEIKEIKKTRKRAVPANTATGRKRHLDAVRESNSELYEEEKNRKKGIKTNSSEGVQDSVALSQRSGRCHGHSPETVRSVLNLRKKNDSKSSQYSGMRNQRGGDSAFVQGATPDLIVGTDFYTSPKNLQQYLNSNLDEKLPPESRPNIAKIYYSEKSESSIDDLMDVTPSTYNIQNGRIDFDSKKKNKQPKFRQTVQVREKDSAHGYADQPPRPRKAAHSSQRNLQGDNNIQGRIIPSNISSASEAYSLYQTKTTFGRGTKSSANTRIDGMLPMSNERIRALEVAYLTKLKPSQRQSQSQQRNGGRHGMIQNQTEALQHLHRVTESSRNVINTREEFNMSGLTQVRVQQPRINNFNQSDGLSQ